MTMGQGMKRGIARKRAFEIIENFASAKILVVGDIMADHFIWGKVSRISPEAPVPVVEVERDKLLLGGCANVVNNIHAMGGRVFLVGVVGEDDMGRKLLDEFHERNIDPSGIIVEPFRPTTVKTRIIAHGQQVVRFDRERRAPIHPDSIAKILAYIETIVESFDAVVISDYNKGVITKSLLDAVRSIISGKGITVCVDPKYHDYSLYQGFDVITPNHFEAERVLGIEDVNGATPDQQARINRAVLGLLDRNNLRALLITRGEKGMSLFERDGGIRHTRFAAEAREVFDVTGAGDTVIGVFALSLAAGANFREAAVLANRAAGIVVGKVGTATVSQRELKKVL